MPIGDEISGSLIKNQTQAVVYSFDYSKSANEGSSLGIQTEHTNTLRTDCIPAVQKQAMAVRSLTPRECERLQGFPDDYTLIPVGKREVADGQRYKALGNSMAVPVMAWIGQRIAIVDAIPDADKSP